MAISKITEYTIYFKENTKAYKQYNGEFISEDKEETDKIFKENEEQVEQYFSKDWVLENEHTLNWQEDYVEIFYSDIN